MRHLRRHADTLAQRRMRVNRLADVRCLCTHVNRQRNLRIADLGRRFAGLALCRRVPFDREFDYRMVAQSPTDAPMPKRTL